jgi:hypothetical protein
MLPKDAIYLPIIYITSSDMSNIPEFTICNEIKNRS